jgi:hypothetical protein
MAVVLAVFSALAIGIDAPTPALADVTTYAHDTLRNGWYPDQPGLSPASVSAPDFGELFSASVSGQVYAQPLVSNGVLLVATETNDVYGFDPETGAQRWTRHLHTPWAAADLNCADLAPNVGITGTPVVDPTPNTEYLLAKTYVNGSSGPAAWWAHAIDVASGAERAGFPLRISGSASNAPRTFDATYEMQRPGLLLMNGVVYAAFGGHCDRQPYQGWVVGFTTAGAVKTLWSTVHAAQGASGIWMSGGGLVSDRAGSLLLTTGNGTTLAAATPGVNPPSTTNFGESVVRLDVQPNGSLVATDFFTPYDASYLNSFDGDLGSAAPIELPSTTFGTAAIPHLIVQSGKEGYVYLLNADNLGGYKQGPQASDAVVSRIGPNGGVWSRPAAWPGDGGWIYLPTASPGPAPGGTTGTMDAYQYGVDGGGQPTLSLVGTSTDGFGFGSGAPVVTSSGTTTGSALMWTTWMAARGGENAQLRAYDPVPVNGTLQLRWSAPIGTGSKFAAPAVSNNRIYVGGLDGHVHAFGRPVQSPMSGSSVQFPDTIAGSSSQATATLTANQTLTVNSASSAPSTFVAGSPTPALPATMHTGDTLSVPITFSPTSVAMASGTLTVSTSAGPVLIGLAGRGVSATPQLSITPTAISFGGIAVGQSTSQSVTVSNTGNQNLTIQSVSSPTSPFSLSGAPANGSTLTPGQSTLVTATFAPTAPGQYASSFTVTSNGGTITVNLTGASGAPAKLRVTPTALDFGPTSVGRTTDRSFTVSNIGDVALTITKSKPPVSGGFTALTALPEGTQLAPGQQLIETVRFAPGAVGTASSTWTLNGDGASTVKNVALSGSGTTTAMNGPALVDFGTVSTTKTKSITVTLSNNGSTNATVTGVSVSAPFAAPLAVGTVIPANGSITFKPSFHPTTSGAVASPLQITTDAGTVSIPLQGRGQLALSALAAGPWSVNGSASVAGSAATLTAASQNQAGTTFYSSPLSFTTLTASFDLTIDQGTGADGATFAIVPSSRPPSSIGAPGGGMAWANLGGVAVAFDTYANPGDPSSNFVGIATGSANDLPVYVKTSSSIPLLVGATVHIEITLNGGMLAVKINGVLAVRTDVSSALPNGALIGFTAATGGLTDRHLIANAAITVS